ncbi:hypothetical protein V8E54_001062 [Elaphomyces granulatus]
MTRPNKRKQLAREMIKEGERWRDKLRETEKSVDGHSEDDELEDEVLMSEAEELEQVNESAFARLMASNVDESRPDLFKTPPGKAQEAAEGQRKDNGELPGHTKFLSEKGRVQRFYNWSA